MNKTFDEVEFDWERAGQGMQLMIINSNKQNVVSLPRQLSLLLHYWQAMRKFFLNLGGKKSLFGMMCNVIYGKTELSLSNRDEY